MSKLKKFDAAEYLDTPERQAAYWLLNGNG